VSQADAVPQSNDTNLLELRNPRVGELTHVGSGMGTDLPDVKIAMSTLSLFYNAHAIMSPTNM
jgi:hypothetical protein